MPMTWQTWFDRYTIQGTASPSASRSGRWWKGDGLEDLVGELPDQGDLPAQLGGVFTPSTSCSASRKEYCCLSVSSWIFCQPRWTKLAPSPSSRCREHPRREEPGIVGREILAAQIWDRDATATAVLPEIAALHVEPLVLREIPRKPRGNDGPQDVLLCPCA